MLLVSLLLGCPDFEATGCDGWTLAPVAEVDAILDGEARSLALGARSEEPGSEFSHLYLTYKLSNQRAGDCPVAIYHSPTEPDPSAVPAIDAENPPPEYIEGVGKRLDRANLPPSSDGYDYDDATLTGHTVSLPPGDEAWITVVACEFPDLHVEVSIEAEYCTGGDVPGEPEPEIPLERWESVMAW